MNLDVGWLLDVLQRAGRVTVEETTDLVGEQLEVQELENGDVVLRCRPEYVDHVRQAVGEVLPVRVRGGLFGRPAGGQA